MVALPISRKKGETKQRIFQVLGALSQGMLAFSGYLVCVVLVINHWFVDWWVASKHYGEQYGGFALTVAILISMVVRHWTTTTGYTVFSFGHQRRISLTNLGDGLVTAVSCLIAIKLWGIIGGPIGVTMGACLVSLPLNLRVIARDTDSSIWRLVSAMLGGWFWRFALLVSGAVWLALYWSPKSPVEAAVAAAVVSVVYVVVMLPILWRPPLGNYVRPLMSSLGAKYAAMQMRFATAIRVGRGL